MILFQAHSGVRYLVLLAGAATLLYALFGAATRRPYDRTMKILASSFPGLIYLQMFLGLTVIASGRFYTALIGHIFMMIFAAAVAQITVSVMSRRAPEQRTFVPHVIGTAIALALVVGGILSIGRPVFGTGG